MKVFSNNTKNFVLTQNFQPFTQIALLEKEMDLTKIFLDIYINPNNE